MDWRIHQTAYDINLKPRVSKFREEHKERWYYTLLMSTGLTFGTISALYGLSHGIVAREQYSLLVAGVIASAVIPTIIANYYFLPRHLLQEAPIPDEELSRLELFPSGSSDSDRNGLKDE